MSQLIPQRFDAATGVAFVVLITAALLLPGRPPKADDSIETITALLIERREAFLFGGYIAGLAAMAFLWFLGGVRDYLRVLGAAELTTAACASGTFAITLMVVGMMMFNGVAFVAARLGDPPLVRALTDTGNGVIEMTKFGFAAFILAVCRAAAPTGRLPCWLIRFGAGSAVLMVASAVALFVDHGIFQFGGVIDLGGAIPAELWIATLSIIMMRGWPDAEVCLSDRVPQPRAWRKRASIESSRAGGAP